MSSKGGCFIGASLSCVDIIVTIYQNYLGLNRNNLSDKNRNIFLLSKGHDVPHYIVLWQEWVYLITKDLTTTVR